MRHQSTKTRPRISLNINRCTFTNHCSGCNCRTWTHTNQRSIVIVQSERTSFHRNNNRGRFWSDANQFEHSPNISPGFCISRLRLSDEYIWVHELMEKYRGRSGDGENFKGTCRVKVVKNLKIRSGLFERSHDTEQHSVLRVQEVSRDDPHLLRRMRVAEERIETVVLVHRDISRRVPIRCRFVQIQVNWQVSREVHQLALLLLLLFHYHTQIEPFGTDQPKSRVFDHIIVLSRDSNILTPHDCNITSLLYCRKSRWESVWCVCRE